LHTLPFSKNLRYLEIRQNKGKVISASEITLTDGVGNVGIYAATAGSKRTSTTPTETVTAKSITSTNTVNSIGIFADNGAYVELSNGMTMTGAKVSDNPIVKTTDSNNEEFQVFYRQVFIICCILCLLYKLILPNLL